MVEQQVLVPVVAEMQVLGAEQRQLMVRQIPVVAAEVFLN
jgi:hypothetical protein